MDFDLNDPLADILSDDDSFFNDDKFKTSTKLKSSPTVDIHTKKTNIFGLDTESSQNKDHEINVLSSKSNIKSDSDWLGLIESTPNTHNLDEKKTTVISKQTYNLKNNSKTNEEIDLLENLGLPDDLYYNKPTNKPNKENSSLDEILNKSSIGQQKSKDDNSNLLLKKDNSSGYTPSISTGTNEKRMPDKKTHSFSDPDTKKTAISKDVSKNTISLANPSIWKSDKKDSTLGIARRQKDKKDWLGLLQDEGEEIFEIEDSHKKKSFSDLLHLNESKNIIGNMNQNKNVSENIVTTSINEADPKQPVKPKNDELNQSQIENTTTKLIVSNDNTVITNLSNNLLDIEKNSAALCLQQQESHLMVALQLKAQEERLASMHEKQEETRRIHNEVVSAHREQQDCILHGIRQNQQRINKHIKTLLFRGEDVEKYLENNERKINHDNLEHVISILKENHEKEIEILHTSYKKQINSITESLILLEDRYKNDQEKLTQYYLSKISILEGENVNLSEKCDMTIEHILQKQLTERERTENKHFNDIEIIQKQHETIINNIRDAYAQEKSTIHETRDYSGKLNIVLCDVEKNNEMCNKIMEKLESITVNNIDVRQRAMEIKEDQINRLLDNLEKHREMYNDEALKTKNILSLMEEKIKQHTDILNEEKSLFKHKKDRFEIEQEKIKKDFEILKNQFEFEKDIFKNNCENIEKTRCEEKLNIDEGNQKLEKEKFIILEEKKLVSNLKSECQELKNKLNIEMEQLNEKKRMLQQESDRICEEEMKILQRSRELEILTRSTVSRQRIAENKVSEANYAQKQYEEKLCRIQEYSLSLNAREQQIAKDKISLSKERLLLYNEQRSIFMPKRLTHFKNENFPRIQDVESQNIYSNYYLDANFAKDINSEDILTNNIKMINFNMNGSKEIKDGFNTLEQINNIDDPVSLKGDYIEKLPNIFQDIVDPKIIAMKLDISNYTANSTIDLGSNTDQFNFTFDNL